MRTRLAVLLAAIVVLGACASSNSRVLDGYAAEAEARASNTGAGDANGTDRTPANEMPTEDDNPAVLELAEALRQPLGLYGDITMAQARCAARAIVESIDVARAIGLVEDAQVSEAEASVSEAADIADSIVECADYRKIFRESMARLYPSDRSQIKCFGDRASKDIVRGVLQLDYLPFEQFSAVSQPLDHAYALVGGCLDENRIREYLTTSVAADEFSTSEAACYANNLMRSFGPAQAFRVHSTFADLTRPDAETYVAAIEKCIDIRRAFFQDWLAPDDPEGLDTCVSDGLTNDELRRIYVGQFSEDANTDADDELLDSYYGLLNRCYDDADQGT